MEGEFRWDIPDLKIIIRDDIAITWGLNHMTAKGPDGKKVDNVVARHAHPNACEIATGATRRRPTGRAR